MKSTSSFGPSLRFAREALGVSQEEFDLVSSRTYISALERDIKQPTIAKIDSLATVLGIHPMTLITLCYCSRMTRDQAKQVLATIAEQVDALFDAHAQGR